MGTHLDKVSGSKSYPKNYLPDLLAEINRQFINISEPEKLGLPQVKGQVQVSNTKKSNIKKLVDTIHETVFSLKQPGRKFVDLNQNIWYNNICYIKSTSV